MLLTDVDKISVADSCFIRIYGTHIDRSLKGTITRSRYNTINRFGWGDKSRNRSGDYPLHYSVAMLAWWQVRELSINGETRATTNVSTLSPSGPIRKDDDPDMAKGRDCSNMVQLRSMPTIITERQEAKSGSLNILMFCIAKFIGSYLRFLCRTGV